MAKTLEMVPKGRATSVLGCEIPNTNATDFVVARATACDEIDANGDSVEVGVNVPRFDFRKDYVPSTDNSYYSFDGVDDLISVNDSNDYTTFTIMLKQLTVQSINNNDRIITKGVTANGEWMVSFATSNRLRVFTKDSNGVTLDYTFTKELVAGTKYNITIEFDYVAGDITVEYDGTDTQTSTNVTWTGEFNSATNIRLATNSSEAQFTEMDIEQVYVFNMLLTTQEKEDIYNGVAIPDEYKGATNSDITAGAFIIGKSYKIATVGTTDFTLIGSADNNVGTEFISTGVGSGTGTATSIGNTLNLSTGKTDIGTTDLVSGWDFTSGWSTSSATIDDADSFTTTATQGYLYRSDWLTVGKSYKMRLAGTAGGTASLRVENNSGTDLMSPQTGTFDETFEFIATDAFILLRGNISTGTFDITTLELYEGGNWYDLEHDIQGAVIGATLNDSTDFGENYHDVNTCSVLLTEPAFNTLFLNSLTPVTQTITTVVGTTYTVNCKNKGIIIISEASGTGQGGTATEVYSFTYTATETSVNVTLVAGHSFDFVQMTDTYYAMNHVATAGGGVAKSTEISTNTSFATIDAMQGNNWTLVWKKDKTNDDIVLTSDDAFFQFKLAGVLKISLERYRNNYLRSYNYNDGTYMLGSGNLGGIYSDAFTFVITYNNGQWEFYRDGVNVESYTETILTQIDELRVGNSKGKNRIEEIITLNETLTPAQVANL